MLGDYSVVDREKRVLESVNWSWSKGWGGCTDKARYFGDERWRGG